jgi:phage gp36-like protein
MSSDEYVKKVARFGSNAIELSEEFKNKIVEQVHTATRGFVYDTVQEKVAGIDVPALIDRYLKDRVDYVVEQKVRKRIEEVAQANVDTLLKLPQQE